MGPNDTTTDPQADPNAQVPTTDAPAAPVADDQGGMGGGMPQPDPAQAPTEAPAEAPVTEEAPAAEPQPGQGDGAV